MRKFSIVCAALIAAPALAAPQSYGVACSTPCSITTYGPAPRYTASTASKPSGYVRNVIQLDPSTAHGFTAPSGTVLVPGLNIGDVATSAQLAAGLTKIP